MLKFSILAPCWQKTDRHLKAVFRDKVHSGCDTLYLANMAWQENVTDNIDWKKKWKGLNKDPGKDKRSVVYSMIFSSRIQKVQCF